MSSHPRSTKCPPLGPYKREKKYKWFWIRVKTQCSLGRFFLVTVTFPLLLCSLGNSNLYLDFFKSAARCSRSPQQIIWSAWFWHRLSFLTRPSCFFWAFEQHSELTPASCFRNQTHAAAAIALDPVARPPGAKLIRSSIYKSNSIKYTKFDRGYLLKYYYYFSDTTHSFHKTVWFDEHCFNPTIKPSIVCFFFLNASDI